jgi:hypothetical protein
VGVGKSFEALDDDVVEIDRDPGFPDLHESLELWDAYAWFVAVYRGAATLPHFFPVPRPRLKLNPELESYSF